MDKELKNKNMFELINAADDGDVAAQFSLGMFFVKRVNQRKEIQDAESRENKVNATKWFKRAAEQGHVKAMFNLANCCMTGFLGRPNYEEAVKWYKKAAEHSFMPALANLGNAYFYGLGVPADYEKAFKLFLKAEDVSPANQFNIALCYDTGKGTKKDPYEAVKWYKKAAEANYPSAQYNLAINLFKGRGVEKNYKKAIEWYKKAAALGHKRAKEALEFLEQR